MIEKSSNPPIRLLVTAYDYRPKAGGIATLGFELLRALNDNPELQVRLLAPKAIGADAFDRLSSVDTQRVFVPKETLSASIFYAGHLSREILSWKPDVILNFLWIPEAIGTYFSWPARICRHTPYIIYAHGVEIMESSISWKRRFRKVLTPLKRRVFKSANQILVNSSFSKQLVSDRCHVDPNKIQVVCPGVDPDLFYPEERAADLVFRYSLTGKKVFLTLTRLDDYKGIDHAILAMKQVIQKYPEVLYLVCGEGRDRGRLEKLIQETALGAHVILVGAIPFDRLRDYYNLADVFVLLSREHQEPPDVEGFGIVFLEAAACGKPVIAGQSGGISDAVKEGVSGWLVPPTDDAAISRAMLEALEKPEKCLKLGHLTRARVLSEFTWKHMAEKTNKIIQQLLWNPLGRD